MSQNQPNIFDIPLWERQEERLLELFTLALEILKQLVLSSVVEEGDLNRELFFCLRCANRSLYNENRGFSHLPVRECPNQPDASDKERALRESKIPDFKWEIIDNQAPPRLSSRYYDVECKRLGTPTSSSWILNKNYVKNGICRFISPTHGYGKSSPSSAMIGYVQNMEMNNILNKVNYVGHDYGFINIILCSNGWKINGVSRLDQRIERPFEAMPFQLRHLWVDLRSNYLS